jgi:hypothetical protein
MPMWFGFGAQSLIPDGIHRNRTQELMAVLQPQPCELRIKLSPASLADDRVRAIDTSDLMVNLGYMDEVYQAGE